MITDNFSIKESVCFCQEATQSLSALAEAELCVEVLGKALQGFVLLFFFTNKSVPPVL